MTPLKLLRLFVYFIPERHAVRRRLRFFPSKAAGFIGNVGVETSACDAGVGRS
jgi:hypothetical protein